MKLDPPTAAPAENVLFRSIRLAIDWINRIAIGLSALGILLALSLIGWSVLMRYVFNRPPVWVDEVVGFLLVVIVTMAAADVLRRGEHIGADIFTSRLSGKARLWAQGWASLAAAATAMVFIVNGWETAMFSRLLGIVTEGHFELPAFWLMLMLPLAGLFMLLTALESLARLWGGQASPTQHPAHGDEK